MANTSHLFEQLAEQYRNVECNDRILFVDAVHLALIMDDGKLFVELAHKADAEFLSEDYQEFLHLQLLDALNRKKGKIIESIMGNLGYNDCHAWRILLQKGDYEAMRVVLPFLSRHTIEVLRSSSQNIETVKFLSDYLESPSHHLH